MSLMPSGMQIFCSQTIILKLEAIWLSVSIPKGIRSSHLDYFKVKMHSETRFRPITDYPEIYTISFRSEVFMGFVYEVFKSE